MKHQDVFRIMKRVLISELLVLGIFLFASSVLAQSSLSSTSLLNAFKAYVSPAPAPSLILPLNKEQENRQVPKAEGVAISQSSISNETLASGLRTLLSKKEFADQLRGPQGVQGPQGPQGSVGPPGTNGSSNSYPAVIYTASPAPSANFSGASYFSATNITSGLVSADTAKVAELKVSSSTVLSGSLDVTGATALGVLTATSFNGLSFTSSTGTLTIANGKILTANNTLTFTGIDGSTLNVGTGGTLGTAAFTAASAYEVPLTISTGLNRSTNTITSNISTGILGGQTIYGGTAANDDLTIEGTSHATKATSYLILQPIGGSVGIGTSSPAGPLHAKGTDASIFERTDSSTALAVFRPISTAASQVSMVWQMNTSADVRREYARISGEIVDNTPATVTGDIVFQPSFNGSFGTERMRIMGSGNVGIGTTAPTGLLHVRTTAGTSMSATGGTITTSGGYTIHTFTTGGTFTPNGAGNVEVLVVAGGGGGGSSDGTNSTIGGGGGAGGMVEKASHTVTAQDYSVTVGAGGPSFTNGGDSVFDGITAIGGGHGATYGSFSGGSGCGLEGCGGATVGGATTQGNSGGGIGYGFKGGDSANTGLPCATSGGGGAGGAGVNVSGSIAGMGGAGRANSISGVSVTYAGGGGSGYSNWGVAAGAGGSGGGGNGGTSGSPAGVAGTANRGAGGGGAGNMDQIGRA